VKILFVLGGFYLLSGNTSAVGTSLETSAEQYSYAIGINFTQSLMRQGAPIDPDAVYMAMRDALDGSKPRLSSETMSTALKEQAQLVGGRKRELAKENLQKGKAFMAKNQKRDGVTTLANSIQYEVLRKGDGPYPPKGGKVKVHYTGTLIDGREFDSSKRRGEPVSFELDSVITGWREILPLMRTGDRWAITIPPNLAYGVNGAGTTIGPNETLVFEIELLEVLN